MSGRAVPSTKLRRSVQAVVIGEWIGFALLALAAILGVSALAAGEASYGVAALVCLVLWFPVLIRSVSICGEVLMERSILFREDRYRIADIALVEVGVSREGPGFGSYVGYVMAIETDSERTILAPSRHCGRRRLEHWADLVSRHQLFTGEVRSGRGNVRGDGPANARSER